MSNPPDSNVDANDSLLNFIGYFAEELNRKRKIDFQDARVNWGRGRLAAFSSRASFIAQFCALNDLNLSGFKSFFASYFGCDASESCVLNDEHLVLLARLIDEPIDLVMTLEENLFFLPACFGEFGSRFYEVKHEQYVSYCPACLARGYHGAFHELPWLYRCPLHGEPLQRMLVESSAASYVSAVANLLRSACASWPDIDGKDAFPREEVPCFTQFRHWLTEVQDQAKRLSRNNVSSLGEKPYAFRDIGILLGRLNTIAPIPDELIDLFIVPPCRQQKTVWDVSWDAVSKIREIIKKFPLSGLLWFYNKYMLTTSILPTSSSVIVDQKISMLKNDHLICHCSWGWNRYTAWTLFSSCKVLPSDQLCPYEYAIRELKRDWLVFTLAEDSSQQANKIETRFFDLCGLILNTELGYFPNIPIRTRGLIKSIRLPKLIFGNDVSQVLDLVLAEQAIAHCDELSNWLSSISTDCIPFRAIPAGNVNLFQSENAAWISSWKNSEAGSVEAVARWKEGCVPLGMEYEKFKKGKRAYSF